MAWVVTRISEETIRSDLMQRGLSVSQVVGLSSRYSILSGDRLRLPSRLLFVSNEVFARLA